MIKARQFDFSDIPAIDDIFHKDPSIGIPSLNHVLVNTTLTDDDKVIGYGVVKNFSEAVLRLDPDLRKRDKVIAFRAAMKVAIEAAKLAGLDCLYVISNSPEFSLVLANQYQFRSVPGELLMLDLTDKEG